MVTAPPNELKEVSDQAESPAPAKPRRAGLWIGSGVAVLALGALVWAMREPSVAQVGGAAIGQTAFAHRLELAAGPQVLQQMVNEEMDLALARAEGALPTDAQVQARLDEAKKAPGFAKSLADSRQTEADLRRGILVKLAQENVVTKGVDVSEDEVKDFYHRAASPDNPSARYHTPDAVQVAAIVLPNQGAADAAVADLASGAPFAEVAKARTVGPNPDQGGLLPAFVKGKTDVRALGPLGGELWGMKPGAQVGPRKASGRWWIVRCVARTQEATVPYAKVKDECASLAKLEKGLRVNGAAIQAKLAELKASSPLELSRPEYKDWVKVK